MKILIRLPYSSKVKHDSNNQMEQDYLSVDFVLATEREAVNMAIDLISELHKIKANLFEDHLTKEQIIFILDLLNKNHIRDYMEDLNVTDD